MTRKEAFKRKTIMPYGRGLVKTWKSDYSKEQLDYLQN